MARRREHTRAHMGDHGITGTESSRYPGCIVGNPGAVDAIESRHFYQGIVAQSAAMILAGVIGPGK